MGFTGILMHTICSLAKSSITAELLKGYTYSVPDENIIHNAVDILIDSIRQQAYS